MAALEGEPVNDTLRAILILAAVTALGLQAFSHINPLPSLAWTSCTDFPGDHIPNTQEIAARGCVWEEKTFFQNVAEMVWPKS